MEKSSKITLTGLVVALAVVSSLFAAYVSNTMIATKTEIGSETDNQAVVTPVADTAEPSFLYVQHAASGAIDPESDDSTDAIYKLTLNGVNNNTMSFSDRPDRTVDQITTARYVYLWTMGQDSFAADPPNAALVMNEADGSEDIVVIELLNPVYDEIKQTLVYDIAALDPEAGLHGFQSGNTTLPTSFGQATLFIDNAYDGNCALVQGADLSYCNFAGADLRDMDLSETNFTGANLQGTDFAWTNLAAVNFSNANLSHANLGNSELYHANLTGADLTGAILLDADLNGCTGYDGCYNMGY